MHAVNYDGQKVNNEKLQTFKNAYLLFLSYTAGFLFEFRGYILLQDNSLDFKFIILQLVQFSYSNVLLYKLCN